MARPSDQSKRNFLRATAGLTAAGAGAATLLTGGTGQVAQALAQAAEGGIDPNSVLAKVVRERKIRIGFAQTLPWFQRDVRSNQLTGIYYDVCQHLGETMQVQIEYVETDFANATVGLRQGRYDVFGSSLIFTMPRALTASYIGPMWHKGTLAATHRDNATRFGSVADFNKPDVTFSLSAGVREETLVRQMFPQARVITVTGQWMLGAEAVRQKRADLWMGGDSDIMTFARRNEWLHIIDPQRPFARAANTWAIRYGDPTWKAFLDIFADHIIHSGFIQERYDFYLAQG